MGHSRCCITGTIVSTNLASQLASLRHRRRHSAHRVEPPFPLPHSDPKTISSPSFQAIPNLLLCRPLFLLATSATWLPPLPLVPHDRHIDTAPTFALKRTCRRPSVPLASLDSATIHPLVPFPSDTSIRCTYIPTRSTFRGLGLRNQNIEAFPFPFRLC